MSPELQRQWIRCGDELLISTELVAVIASHGSNAMHHEPVAVARTAAAEGRVAFDGGMQQIPSEHAPGLARRAHYLDRGVGRVNLLCRRRKDPISVLDAPQVGCDERKQSERGRAARQSIAGDCPYESDREQ